AQPQPQAPQAAPQVAPQLAPKVESAAEPKDDNSAAPVGGGRFTFNRIDNGVLRFDTQNGQVAYCRAQTTGWSCQAAAEKRSDGEAWLACRRAAVRYQTPARGDFAGWAREPGARGREGAARKAPPPPRPPANLVPSDKGGDVSIRLPTQEDVARARALIEKTWQRLVEMITAVQKDVLQKS